VEYVPSHDAETRAEDVCLQHGDNRAPWLDVLSALMPCGKTALMSCHVHASCATCLSHFLATPSAAKCCLARTNWSLQTVSHS